MLLYPLKLMRAPFCLNAGGGDKKKGYGDCCTWVFVSDIVVLLRPKETCLMPFFMDSRVLELSYVGKTRHFAYFVTCEEQFQVILVILVYQFLHASPKF